MSDAVAEKVAELLAEVRALHPRVRRVAVQLDNSIRLVPTDEIVYATMSEDGNRLRIIDKGETEYFNFSSVGNLAELLVDDRRFMRVHKSFLVNLDFVTQIETVSGGRELSFDVIPELRVKVAQGNVKAVEAYFGI